MFLLFAIVIMNCITAFAHELIAPVKKLLLRPSSAERKLQSEIAALDEQLAQISMRDEFNSYVKTERKKAALENELQRLQLKNSFTNTAISFGTGYVFQAILTFILFIVSLWYRYTPVIEFDSKFNFSPFSSVINFPTGVENAISVPFWIFVSNFSLRCLAGSVRTIKW